MANEPEKTSNETSTPRSHHQEESTRADQQMWKRWSELVAQIWTDKKLKQRLMDESASVLREHGIGVPTDLEIRVVENTDKISYFILPAQPRIQLN